MGRSHFTLDLEAVRHNTRTLMRALVGAELWAVVKADAYGHGAADVARAALEAGATALCVATVDEANHYDEPSLRRGSSSWGPRPTTSYEEARRARIELVVSTPGPVPDRIPVHLKLDTGMGRWGLSS